MCHAAEGQCWWDATTSTLQAPAGTQVEIVQRPSGSDSSPFVGVEAEGMGQWGWLPKRCCNPVRRCRC